jgi:toxin FitB
MAWLLDTNIRSELRGPKPDQRVVGFIAGCALAQLFVSTVTLAEIRFGIELIGDPERRAELSQWLAQQVRPVFRERVLPLTEDIIFQWRLLVEQGRKTGHTFSQPDLFIAATAIQHGLIVVTRDRSEFEIAGVAAFNPWQPT